MKKKEYIIVPYISTTPHWSCDLSETLEEYSSQGWIVTQILEDSKLIVFERNTNQVI